MASKSAHQKKYVGPRALFDPSFIPEKMIGLEKEQHSMEILLEDAVQDHFPLALSLYGLRGVGKTTLTYKTIINLIQSNSIKLHTCYINCEEKEPEEILFAIINRLSTKMNYEIEPISILNATSASQMNLLTHLITKTQRRAENDQGLLFFFDSIEYTKPTLINKLMDVITSQSCYLVTSFNLLMTSPYLMEFKKPDIQFQLHTYEPKELEKISRNRCDLAFKHPVETGMIRYITDLVTEYDCCVPESCLRVYRELYPLIESGALFEPSQIQEACRFRFKGYSIDEIGVAEFVSETEMVDRVALDEISSFFQSQCRYYISYVELINMYKVACESMEYEFKIPDFHAFLGELQRVGLLQPSNFPTRSRNNESLYRSDQLFFLSISPQLFGDILDVSFGQFGFSFD